MKSSLSFALILYLIMLISISFAQAQSQCLTNADNNPCDGTISLNELTSHINAWYACSSCVPDIFNSLQGYFHIPFCGDWSCNATVGEDCSTCSNDCGNCTAPQPNASFQQDYIAYWKFEGNLSDTSMYGNDGSCTNCPAYVAGQVGQAVDFDGIDDYVVVNNDPSLNMGANTGFSVSVWLKYNSTYSGVVISKDDDVNGYDLLGNDVVGGYFREREGGNANDILYGSPVFDTWTHIVSGRNSSNRYVYLNGVLVASAADSSLADLSNALNLSIGSESGVFSFFNGIIDEVMIFNRSLSLAEIQQIFTSQGGTIPCSNDIGCTSAGSFCNGNIPYTCTLNASDGCLDRVDGVDCSPDTCINGACIPIVCGDNVCSSGENCPADAVGCADNICYEPTCLNGCGQTLVAAKSNDESCLSPSFCDGAGSCVDCIDDGDCLSGEYCNSGNCVPVGSECVVDSDCAYRGPGFICNSGNVCEWEAPIGVPKPSFGIEESVDMYIGQQYAFTDGRGTINYPISSATGDPYTHYIDNSGTCNDTNNPYGTESNPRCTIPHPGGLDGQHHYLVDLQPGDVYEIHGTHEFNVIWTGATYGWLDGYEFRGGGTKSQPAFIRSDPNNPAVFIGDQTDSYGVDLTGSFIIMENLEFNNSFIEIYGNNLSMRNSEVHSIVRTNGRAVNIKDSRDTVFYNNHVHHNWGTYPDGSHDMHNTAVTWDSHNIWVVDNYLHHASYMPNGTAAYTGGDAIQVMGPPNEPWKLTKVYIGRNHMHTDTENAVDIKASTNVVISQNIAHDYHNEGVMINHEMANYTWFMFNEIYDARVGVRPEDAIEKAFVLNNVIHDIDYPLGNVTSIFGVYVGGVHGRIVPSYVIGNTLYNVTGGILVPVGTQNNFWINNIVSTMPKPWYHFGSDQTQTCSAAEIDYNLVYQPTGIPGYTPDGVARIKCSGVYNGLSSFQAAWPSKCINCIESDPMFVDAQGGDFSLQAGSPAIDNGTNMGTVQQVYDEYYRIFGVNISVDFNGNPRTGQWDIGAYEY